MAGQPSGGSAESKRVGTPGSIRRMAPRPLLRSFASLLLAGLLLGVAAPTSCWFSDRDAYGGWTGRTLAATGRFRVESVDGVWWLVTPDGHPFFSAGVNNISSCTDWAPALGTCP